jgi:hypothetical protein
LLFQFWRKQVPKSDESKAETQRDQSQPHITGLKLSPQFRYKRLCRIPHLRQAVEKTPPDKLADAIPSYEPGKTIPGSFWLKRTH